MKIAIIGSAHPLRGGGISTFNERLATELQGSGHDVTIYSFSLQYPSFLFPGKFQFTEEPAPRGLVIRSIINSINPLNWIASGRAIKKDRPELVIVRYWLPFMGPCLGTILRIVKGAGCRILCITDNLIPHEQRPGDKQFTKYFIKPVDVFLTMSREVLKDVQGMTDKPSCYTPHPVYDNYGQPESREAACALLQLEPGKKYLLFFGFIREYKGLDLLLEAMGDERIKKAGLELIVAGEYYNKELATEHEQIIARHGLQDVVHMRTNFIPNNEVSRYFSAADVVVQPYKHATQSGITQIAYHFEKPMIVTNVGGLAETVPDGKVGFVTQPNAAAIADAIVKFYGDGAIAHLHENILEEKKKYTWDTFTGMLLRAAFGK